MYSANVLIMGGDITGKAMIPVVKTREGSYSSFYLSGKVALKNLEEVLRFEDMVSSAGFYPYRTDEEGYEELQANPKMVEEIFTSLMVSRLKSWVRMAEARLGGTGVRCFIQPGNDDSFAVDAALQGSGVVVNPEGSVQEIDGKFEMISTGYTNMTPWHCPRDVSDEELYDRMEKMLSQVKDSRRCIFNVHCPPYGTPIDAAPELDQQMKVKYEAGAIKMIPAGSKAVRKLIEMYEPALGLHGHIHESPGWTWVGKTLCLNPGSEYTKKVLRGAIVTLSEDRVKSYFLAVG